MAEIFIWPMGMVLGQMQCPKIFRHHLTPHNMLPWTEQGPTLLQTNGLGMHPHVMQSCQHAQVGREGVASTWYMPACPYDGNVVLHGLP